MKIEIPDKPIAVTVARAATLIGVSRATIRDFAKSGRLRIARVGRRVIVPMNSLEQFVRECTKPQEQRDRRITSPPGRVLLGEKIDKTLSSHQLPRCQS
jgi:excisionase family DNA binding protein